MSRNYSVLLILTLMGGTLCTASVGPTLQDVHGDGFLERYDGGRLLHVKGEPRTIGIQYGYLLADELTELFPVLREKFTAMYGLAPELYYIVRDLIVIAYTAYLPADIMEELQGILIGVEERRGHTPDFELSDLIMVNCLIDAAATMELATFGCSGFAAWGPLTEAGKLFSTRNIDLFTGYGLEDYTLVTIVKQTSKTPFTNVGFVGMIGSIAGMNGNGMSFAQIWGYSTDTSFGTPWPITARKILQEADAISDVIHLFETAHRTYGSNFVFSDAQHLNGVCLETTATLCPHFFDDDPGEDQATYNGECYAIRIPYAVFRASVVLDQTVRSMQYSNNGPDGDPRTTEGYIVRYKGQADRILDLRDRGIPIDAQQAVRISREVAAPGESMLCVAYANSDLELWAAYSSIDAEGIVHDACDQPYRQIDIDHYLPTIHLDMTSTMLRTGDTHELVVRTDNIGHEAALDLYLALDTSFGLFYYPTFGSRPESIRITTAHGERSFPRAEVSFPMTAEVPTGPYTWLAALVEPVTGRPVDIAIVEFTVWH
ncbi:hypothetical protein JW905_17640 [bacterium]|nr:hypothetical protein [candidate division CSSED10-310 bacterium]